MPDADAQPDPRRYPLLLDLTERDVLVVGGGPVAARRASGLLAAGARVHVIAPQLCEDLADLVATGVVGWSPRDATASDVAEGPGGLATDPAGPAAPDSSSGSARWWLVHTTTGVADVDDAISAEAQAHGIWCARADRAVESAAHLPAVTHGPDGIQVAVSGGGDPGRARAIRDAIADLLTTGRLPLRRTRPVPSASAPQRASAQFAAGHVSLDETGRSPDPRTLSDESGPVSDQLLDANGARSGTGSRERGPIRGEVEGFRHPPAALGRVVLVGGGPGDPGLLTVAGRQWLARADVVVTDRLGPTSVLSQLDPAIEIIDVGKTAGHHPIPQHEINRILVEQAQRGHVVVRLKGGDPFVLGRGGEEALHCLAAGVPVEVVPGVTSAVSVAAAAGIPVTHRGITTSFVVASAHAGAGSAQRAAQNAPDDATLVLLMGLSALGTTAAELIAAGRAADLPVAVVSRGSTAEQRTVVGTLETIAADVTAARMPGPAIVIVGEVVRLRERLAPLDRTTQP